MSDVSVTLAVAAAAVLLASAFGKLSSSGAPAADRAVGTAEAALAALLLSGVAPVIAAAATVAAAGGFVVHAFTRRPEERCSCFGSWLPTTSVAGQRARNAALLVVATADFAVVTAIATDGGGGSHHPVLAVTGGIVTGAAMVAGPWLADWVRVA
jgi:hypothetical protein